MESQCHLPLHALLGTCRFTSSLPLLLSGAKQARFAQTSSFQTSSPSHYYLLDFLQLTSSPGLKSEEDTFPRCSATMQPPAPGCLLSAKESLVYAQADTSMAQLTSALVIFSITKGRN